MANKARACTTMKFNYQSYANSTALDTSARRAAVIIAWVNKAIYLYHFAARKKRKRFHSESPSMSHFFLLFVSRYFAIDDFLRALTYFIFRHCDAVNHAEAN